MEFQYSSVLARASSEYDKFRQISGNMERLQVRIPVKSFFTYFITFIENVEQIFFQIKSMDKRENRLHFLAGH